MEDGREGAGIASDVSGAALTSNFDDDGAGEDGRTSNRDGDAGRSAAPAPLSSGFDANLDSSTLKRRNLDP